MKAIVRVLENEVPRLTLQEVEMPKPKANEVLIKILAASLNKADLLMLKGIPRIMKKMGNIKDPKFGILGSDIAGVIEAVGSEVHQFKIGDEVFGEVSSEGFGGFAEYTCVNEKVLCKKPSEISFEAAAAVPMAATTALQGLRDRGMIEKGNPILINGASGGVGSYAIQIAKYFGAKVTAVCSTAKMNHAKDLGANNVIDYTKDDFTKMNEKYDLIFDIVGNQSVSSISNVLKPGGRYVNCGFSLISLFMGWWYAWRKGQHMINLIAKPTIADLQFITKLMEEGNLKANIQQTFSLDDVPEAFDTMKAGSLYGKLVITL